jgi:hypothetical protein
MDERRPRQLLETGRTRLESLLSEKDEAELTDRLAVGEPDGFSDPCGAADGRGD